MTGDEKVKTVVSDGVSYYDIFESVWWNLTELSVLYLLLIFFAAIFFRSSEPVVKVYEAFTDFWPVAALLCIILVLALIERVVLKKHTPKWSGLRARIRKRKIEASGVLMSMGSVIFIVSDLHFHTLAPLVVSMVIWWLALWLEKNSESGGAEINQSNKDDGSGNV